MSVHAMGRVWNMDLPHNHKFVLLALADHADHDGRNMFPSVALISQKTGYSVRSVQGILKSLLAEGHLEIQEERPGYTTIYMIPTPAKTAPPQDSHHRKNCTPANSSDTPRKNCTPTPAESAPPSNKEEPSLEPSSNHQHLAAGAKPPTAEELFEIFAKEYPPRLGDLCKAKAKRDHLRKTFGKPALASQVIDGARRYRRFVEATGDIGTRLVCQMTTWLNQERWTEPYDLPGPNVPKAPPRQDHSKPLAGIDYVLFCPEGESAARYFEPDRSGPFDAIGWFEKRRLPIDRNWEKYCDQQMRAD